MIATRTECWMDVSVRDAETEEPHIEKTRLYVWHNLRMIRVGGSGRVDCATGDREVHSQTSKFD